LTRIRSQNRLQGTIRQASSTKPRKFWAWCSQPMRMRRRHRRDRRSSLSFLSRRSPTPHVWSQRRLRSMKHSAFERRQARGVQKAQASSDFTRDRRRERQPYYRHERRNYRTKRRFVLRSCALRHRDNVIYRLSASALPQLTCNCSPTVGTRPLVQRLS
jgi:hypothetical protein